MHVCMHIFMRICVYELVFVHVQWTVIRGTKKIDFLCKDKLKKKYYIFIYKTPSDFIVIYCYFLCCACP